MLALLNIDDTDLAATRRAISFFSLLAFFVGWTGVSLRSIGIGVHLERPVENWALLTGLTVVIVYLLYRHHRIFPSANDIALLGLNEVHDNFNSHLKEALQRIEAFDQNLRKIPDGEAIVLHQTIENFESIKATIQEIDKNMKRDFERTAKLAEAADRELTELEKKGPGAFDQISTYSRWLVARKESIEMTKGTLSNIDDMVITMRDQIVRLSPSTDDSDFSPNYNDIYEKLDRAIPKVTSDLEDTKEVLVLFNRKVPRAIAAVCLIAAWSPIIAPYACEAIALSTCDTTSTSQTPAAAP